MKTENLALLSQPKHHLNLRNQRQRSVSPINYVDNTVVGKSMNKTTAGLNPSGRLSFKRAPIVVPVAKTIGEKIAVNKYFNKFLDILADNSLIADALIALGLTGVMRPLFIYSIPAKDTVEKKKNNYQVCQSISTGLLGLGTTLAVAEPIKRGVKKVLANPEKYMKTDVSYVKNNERVFKETAGRLHQPLFLPLRAMLTIAIVPPILKALGLSKTGKPVNVADKTKIDYSFMNFKGNETNKAFKDVANISLVSSKKPSFKGLGGIVTEGIAKGIGKVADTKGFRKFIEWFKEKDKWFPHLIAAESLWLSSFYMYNTGKSKKIEKDQKLAMMLNQGITALLCTIGAYKIDGVVNNKLASFKETYKRMNPELTRKANIYDYLIKKAVNNPDKLNALKTGDAAREIREASKRLNTKLIGIRLLGPMVIFTTIYRFVGPVLVTPFANWLSEKIQPHKKAA